MSCGLGFQKTELHVTPAGQGWGPQKVGMHRENSRAPSQPSGLQIVKTHLWGRSPAPCSSVCGVPARACSPWPVPGTHTFRQAPTPVSFGCGSFTCEAKGFCSSSLPLCLGGLCLVSSTPPVPRQPLFQIVFCLLSHRPLAQRSQATVPRAGVGRWDQGPGCIHSQAQQPCPLVSVRPIVWKKPACPIVRGAEVEQDMSVLGQPGKAPGRVTLGGQRQPPGHMLCCLTEVGSVSLRFLPLLWFPFLPG